MNWLDVILIVVNVIIILGGLGLIMFLIKETCDFVEGLVVFLGGMFIIGIVLLLTMFLPFLVLDKGSGSTIGVITSVDANFWGNTYIYIKTSETAQEKYCIEDKEISNKAKELIGEKVKIYYGTRIGFYSTGKCNQAPVEQIDEVLGGSDEQ